MTRFTQFALAAAAVLIVAVLGYSLLPAPTGTVGGKPTPSPSLSPAPVVTPTAGPMTPPQVGSPLALTPGAYLATRPFLVNVGFTVPAGWQGNVGGPYFMAVERTPGGRGGIYFAILGTVFADPCRFDAGLASPSTGPTVDDLVSALTHLKGVTATTPVDATIAGYAAKSFTLSRSTSAGSCAGGVVDLWQLPLGGVAEIGGVGQRDRIWVLTVGDTRLVIAVEDYSSEDSAARAEVQAVLDSVTIAP